MARYAKPSETFGEWVETALCWVITDSNGKILASVQHGPASAPYRPLPVVVRGASIGEYINLDCAKKAAERALGIKGQQDDSIIESLVSRFRKLRESEI